MYVIISNSIPIKGVTQPSYWVVANVKWREQYKHVELQVHGFTNKTQLNDLEGNKVDSKNYIIDVSTTDLIGDFRQQITMLAITKIPEFSNATYSVFNS